MSTTQSTTGSTTYTRQELSSKTVEELKDICRSDRAKYAGFSNYTKRPLVEFILKGGRPGLWPSRASIRRKTISQSVRTNQELWADDYSQDLTTMFESSTYENEYDSFEIDDNDDTFDSYPSKDDIIKTITEIENVIKSNDDNSNITWESYNDEDKTEIYNLSKKQLYRKYGKLGEEKILLHGTDECNIKEILENDFSLTINIKHGTAYGKGIYFTNDVRKALEYSERGKMNKYILMVKVYIGDCIQGSLVMDIHPKIPGTDKRYDTSVDNTYGPIQFIKKNNSQVNIVGIVKIGLSNPDISRFGLTLKCNLKIHNNSNRKITTYFSFTPFKDGIIKTEHKYLSNILTNSSSSYKTDFGHHFALIVKDFGIIRLIKIDKLKTEITIEDKYILSDKKEIVQVEKKIV